VNWAVQAADELRNTRGIRCDVIDPRTPSPLDEETILESVAATGRLVVIDESPPRCGLTADIAALVADKGFRDLKAPIKTVTAPHTPVPQARELERAYLPNPRRIIAAVEEVLA
jgi:pyruvate dehydrogenase E1 component beta subunit